MCAGCGCGRSDRNGFLLCVLQREVVSACVVLCAFLEPVVADRIVVAASRLLGAEAACVILLSCAAASRK